MKDKEDEFNCTMNNEELTKLVLSLVKQIEVQNEMIKTLGEMIDLKQ